MAATLSVSQYSAGKLPHYGSFSFRLYKIRGSWNVVKAPQYLANKDPHSLRCPPLIEQNPLSGAVFWAARQGLGVAGGASKVGGRAQT